MTTPAQDWLMSCGPKLEQFRREDAAEAEKRRSGWPTPSECCAFVRDQLRFNGHPAYADRIDELIKAFAALRERLETVDRLKSYDAQRVIAEFLSDCDPDGPDCADPVGWLIRTHHELVRQLNEKEAKS